MIPLHPGRHHQHHAADRPRRREAYVRELLPEFSHLGALALTSLARMESINRASPTPTPRDEIGSFRELVPVACAASPSATEATAFGEELDRRSQERIEALAQQLSGLPISQARRMVELECTQVQRAFEEGKSSWGTGAHGGMWATDNPFNDGGPRRNVLYPASPPRKPPPSPGSTGALLLVSPRMSVLPPGPRATRSLDARLVETKASTSGAATPADAD
ncbi:hypothetical protein FRC08_005245, partial [Ceratobasidium sp. 394]